MGPIISTTTNENSNHHHNIESLMRHQSDEGLECSKNLWVPDEVWFHIFSYMNPNVLGGQGSFNGVPDFFRKVAFLSKPLYCIAVRFLKRMPLIIEHHYFLKTALLRRIAWAAAHGVKLGGVSIFINSENACAIHKFMLTSCDVSRMTVCNIQDDWMELDVKQSAAIEAGIPPHCFRQAERESAVTAISNDTICDYKLDFQEFFAKFVSSRASLRCMKVDLWKGEWHLPIITNSSNSLRELTLSISQREDSKISGGDTNVEDGDLQELSSSIQQLVVLKKLKLSFLWKKCLFDIESKSLEHIDMTGSEEGCFLNKCSCPSLQVFKCNYKASSPRQSNGLLPTTRYPENIAVGKKQVVHMSVSQHSFVGTISIPSKCRLSITYI